MQLTSSHIMQGCLLPNKAAAVCHLLMGCGCEAAAIIRYLLRCFISCLIVLLQGCLQGCPHCIVCCQIKRTVSLLVRCSDICVAFYKQLHHIEMP